MLQFIFRMITRCLLFCLLPAAGLAQPVAHFSANTTAGCSPMVVQFTDMSTPGVNTWSWDFGNGITSTLQHPSTTFTTPGSYTITLTASGPTGSNTKTVTGYINAYAPPDVDFVVNDTAGCPPHTIQPISMSTLNAPGAGTYIWNFGNGVTQTGSGISYTYPASGYYTITHTAQSGVGCATTVQKPAYIHVFDRPDADFNTPFQVICGLGSQVPFYNTTTSGTPPYTIQWDFGDGNTTTNVNPTHGYANYGNYTVNIIVTDDNGCSDTATKYAYVHVVADTGTFSAPGNVCVGESFIVVNTTPLSLYQNWNFGDGTTDTSTAVVHTYNSPGIYTISLTANNGTCFPYAEQTITVHPAPIIDFTANVLTPCPAPATVQFTNSTTNAVSYTWDFGDGGSATTANPTHTYANNGFYDVTLTAVSGQGCVNSLTKFAHVKIYDMILTAETLPPEGCIPLEVDFTALVETNSLSGTIPYPSSVTSYFWDLGDGNTTTTATLSHIYTTTGTFNGYLAVTTANGCTDTVTFEINTGNLPVAGFSAMPTVVCVDQPIQFTNTSTGASTFTWDFGDGGSSANANPVYSYSSPGLYPVRLIASDNGCDDTLIIPGYITVNYPISEFTADYACDTLTKVVLTNQSQGYTSCLWIFGDGTTSTDDNPTHVYPGLGTYQLQLVTYNSTTGCTDTADLTVTLFTITANFTASDTAICPGDMITLNAVTPDPLLVSTYHWLIGNVIIADTSADIPFTFQAPGVYSVSLIIEDAHGCPDTVTRTNYIIVGLPDVNFIASDSTLCVPATTLFTSTGTTVPGTTPASYTWDFGTGGGLQTTTAASISVGYPDPGLYTVTLYVTDNIGCLDSLTKVQYIQVNNPEAGFVTNTIHACVGAPFPFYNTSTGTQLTYWWDFGDGGTDTVAMPSHTYSMIGSYTVTLVITDNIGCTDTMIKHSYVNVWDRPVAAFSMSDSFAICPPLHISFTNNSTGAIVYNWNMGDGTSFTGQNPSHVFVDPGVYSVRLIAINQYGCRDTAYHEAELLGYDGAFSYAPLSGCAPLTVNFTASVTNVPGLIFDFGDGNTFATTTGTATHTYLSPGPVLPRVIMTDNLGCSATSYGTDTIRVDGVYAGFTYDPFPACDSGLLVFTDTSRGAYSSITDRLWVFHDGTTSTAISPSHYYPGIGDYPIVLYTITATGCMDTLHEILSFHPSPVIDAGSDTTICVGDYAVLTPAGGVSYVWTDLTGGTLNCTDCTRPHASPSTPTMYLVEGTDINGCKNTDSVTVFLKTKTESIAGGDTAICRGTTVQLYASGGQHYEWTPGRWLNYHDIPAPLATPQESVTYQVVAYEGSCIPDTNTVNITVHQLPEIDAGTSQIIVAGETALLSATGSSQVSRYEWMPAESLNCTDCREPEATPKNTTTYRVYAYNSFGCRATDTVTVFVICRESQVFIPNSFTPNNDGQNDRFYPRGKGIESIRSFRIYNRWGELIFEQRDMQVNDFNTGWDGTYKGVLLNPDVFVYVVDAICDTGEPVTLKGDISLIR